MREGSAIFGEMSGSGRRRVSKWDLKEGSLLPLDNIQENAWAGKGGGSFHSKESHSLKASAAWDGGESYGARMSPGLDDWRMQNRHRSPKNEWNKSRRSRSRSRSQSRSRSWSRSRSPVRGFRRESGAYEKSRGRSGVSSQLCKEYAAGRCRRGGHCQFLHQATQNYDDDWENRHIKAGAPKFAAHDSREYPLRSERSTDCCYDFLKGKCRKGAACKYSHHVASDGFGKGSSNEVIREREIDRRHRDASLERIGEREPRRIGDVPCKFFAVGNCRNGKHCRFAHVSARVSPDRRSRDDKWLVGRNSEDADKPWTGPKWSDTNAFSDTATLSEDKGGKLGASESRYTSWSVDDRWGLNDNKTHGDPAVSHKAVEKDKDWKTEKKGDSMYASESRGTDWLGDMAMSPEWNYGVQPSSHVMKEHSTSNDISLHTCKDITQEASGRIQDTNAVLQPMINENSSFQQQCNLREGGAVPLPIDDNSALGKSASSHIDLNFSANILPGGNFDQSAQSSSALPLSSLNGGQGQVAIPTDPSRGGSTSHPQNQALFQEGKPIHKPVIGDANTSQANSGILPPHNMVSGEQLTHLTNLSASLAQLLANGQQLPQLYAALNPNNTTDASSFANSKEMVEPNSVVNVPSDQPIIIQEQYDPIADSIDPKSIADRKLEMPSRKLSPLTFATGGPNGNKDRGIEDPNHKSRQLTQVGTVGGSDVIEVSSGVGTEETKKVKQENKVVQENVPLGDVDGDGRADEGKKSKDVKGVRAFKFALVEFVKELLKPAWKEGQISKEAYKNIVKKAVDKVTGAMQDANIPQTQEKIDQYLSFSKAKLTKLVQAYVEKFQKAK